MYAPAIAGQFKASSEQLEKALLMAGFAQVSCTIIQKLDFTSVGKLVLHIDVSAYKGIELFQLRHSVDMRKKKPMDMFAM